MALTVTVQLSPEQSQFVREVAHQLNPGMTDPELEAFMADQFTAFMVRWLVEQFESREGQMVEQAQEAVRRRVKNARYQAHQLFKEGQS